jgi:hypothetical protein
MVFIYSVLTEGCNCLPLTLGLAAVLEFYMPNLEPQPNRITDDEGKNKNQIELRLPKLLLIANKKMKIYSSASIAAKPPVEPTPMVKDPQL